MYNSTIANVPEFGSFLATWDSRHWGTPGVKEEKEKNPPNPPLITCEPMVMGDPPGGGSGGGGFWRPGITKPSFDTFVLVWIEVQEEVVVVTHEFPDLDPKNKTDSDNTFWSTFDPTEHVDMLTIPDPRQYADADMANYDASVFVEDTGDGNSTIERIEFDRNSMILFRDINENGELDDFNEIRISHVMSTGEPSTSAAAALAGFDSPALGGDGNNKLTSEDAVWNDLYIWVDLDESNTPSWEEVMPIASIFSKITTSPQNLDAESFPISSKLGIHDFDDTSYPLYNINLYAPSTSD